MRRNDMDIPVGLIIIAILALLLALGFLFGIAKPQKESERYINELKAQTEMLKHARPLVVGNYALLPAFRPNGDFEWHKEIIPTPLPTGTGQGQIVVDSSVHDDAAALIDATMIHPSDKRRSGQLMTADECQQYSILNGDRTRRQAAVDYLCKYYDVESVNDKGGKNGVYYRGNSGDLSRLMLDLAVSALPYPNQRPPVKA